MTSSVFSFATAIGAVINTIQTGWLFNKLISHDVSIPIITCLAGVCGGAFPSSLLPIATGIAWVLTSRNLIMALIGSLIIIMAYGCAAPTAPAIMSVRLSRGDDA